MAAVLLLAAGAWWAYRSLIAGSAVTAASVSSGGSRAIPSRGPGESEGLLPAVPAKPAASSVLLAPGEKGIQTAMDAPSQPSPELTQAPNAAKPAEAAPEERAPETREPAVGAAGSVPRQTMTRKSAGQEQFSGMGTMGGSSYGGGAGAPAARPEQQPAAKSPVPAKAAGVATRAGTASQAGQHPPVAQSVLQGTQGSASPGKFSLFRPQQKSVPSKGSTTEGYPAAGAGFDMTNSKAYGGAGVTADPDGQVPAGARTGGTAGGAGGGGAAGGRGALAGGAAAAGGGGGGGTAPTGGTAAAGGGGGATTPAAGHTTAGGNGDPTGNVVPGGGAYAGGGGAGGVQVPGVGDGGAVNTRGQGAGAAPAGTQGGGAAPAGATQDCRHGGFWKDLACTVTSIQTKKAAGDGASATPGEDGTAARPTGGFRTPNATTPAADDATPAGN